MSSFLKKKSDNEKKKNQMRPPKRKTFLFPFDGATSLRGVAKESARKAGPGRQAPHVDPLSDRADRARPYPSGASCRGLGDLAEHFARGGRAHRRMRLPRVAVAALSSSPNGDDLLEALDDGGHLDAMLWLKGRMPCELRHGRLTQAIARGHLRLAKWLSARGEGFRLSRDMSAASRSGCYDALAWVASAHLPRVEDAFPTAVRIAARSGYAEVVRRLVYARAERYERLRCAVIGAAEGGHAGIIRMLRSFDASAEVGVAGRRIVLPNRLRREKAARVALLWTVEPCALAARNGHVEALAELHAEDYRMNGLALGPRRKERQPRHGAVPGVGRLPADAGRGYVGSRLGGRKRTAAGLHAGRRNTVVRTVLARARGRTLRGRDETRPSELGALARPTRDRAPLTHRRGDGPFFGVGGAKRERRTRATGGRAGLPNVRRGVSRRGGESGWFNSCTIWAYDPFRIIMCDNMHPTLDLYGHRVDLFTRWSSELRFCMRSQETVEDACWIVPLPPSRPPRRADRIRRFSQKGIVRPPRGRSVSRHRNHHRCGAVRR